MSAIDILLLGLFCLNVAFGYLLYRKRTEGDDHYGYSNQRWFMFPKRTDYLNWETGSKENQGKDVQEYEEGQSIGANLCVVIKEAKKLVSKLERKIGNQTRVEFCNIDFT